MYCSVVAEQEIATDEGTLAFLALEGTLLGVCEMGRYVSKRK